MIAILPAAGKGTRMAEITGAGSKEMVRVGGKAAIQWVLEEAWDAGVKRVIVIASQEKPDLLKFLDGKAEVVFQLKPEGHGAAVAVASADEPVLVLNPDTVFFPSSPVSRIAQRLSEGFDVVLAVETVPEAKVSKYGIVEWDGQTARATRILEKPSPTETDSRWAIAGRFGLSLKAFEYLKNQVASESREKEVSLTAILGRGLASSNLTAAAVPLNSDEVRLDCGDPAGYLNAQTSVHSM